MVSTLLSIKLSKGNISSAAVYVCDFRTLLQKHEQTRWKFHWIAAYRMLVNFFDQQSSTPCNNFLTCANCFFLSSIRSALHDFVLSTQKRYRFQRWIQCWAHALSQKWHISVEICPKHSNICLPLAGLSSYRAFPPWPHLGFTLDLLGSSRQTPYTQSFTVPIPFPNFWIHHWM